MKKISKGTPKKWTSTPGSYGDSFLIEGGPGSHDNEPYDKYVEYVTDKNQVAEKAFRTTPYGEIKIKCPKCGSEVYMSTKKADGKIYKCAVCNSKWEKKIKGYGI